MAQWRRVMWAIGAAAAVALPGAAHAGVWNEVGDAGDLAGPQVTVGSGPLNSISGVLQPMDPIDVFKFFHPPDPILPGDPMDVTADWNDPALSDALFFALFDATGTTLIAQAGADGNIFISNLASGDYLVAVSTSSIADPEYTITFNTPVAFAAPEPAPLALLLAGTLGLAFARRCSPAHGSRR